MKIKEGVLESVAEELEQENTLSEISVPDETSSVTTVEKENAKQNGHIEQTEKQSNPMIDNEHDNKTNNISTENGYSENGIAGAEDGESISVDKTDLPEQHLPDPECSNHQPNYLMNDVANDSSSSCQLPLNSDNSSSAYEETNDAKLIYDQDQDINKDRKSNIQTIDIDNGCAVQIDNKDDSERTDIVVKLTKENLKHHTKTMKNDNGMYQVELQEKYREKIDCPVSVTNENVDPIQHDNIENDFSEKNVSVSSKTTSVRKQNSKSTPTRKKPVSVNSDKCISITSPKSLRQKCNVNDTINQDKVSGLFIDLENVETLVSRHKISKKKKTKHNRKVINTDDCNVNGTSPSSGRISGDAVIHMDSEENNHSQNNKQNDVNGNLKTRANQEARGDIKQGDSRGHKRLLKRGRQHKFHRRLPVYDANNTSTRMILLNNKYGKNSRLWTSKECQLDRGKLINPLRHMKEPSFYLSGNFHARCSTSEESIRPCFTPMTTKFDFSDRPQSDKIGDRLYEAKVSVNPSRHRSCQCTLPPLQRPLNFSAPTQQERSNRFMFAWERLYAEPQLRPVSSIRPYSSLTEKKAGVHAVKMPHILPTHQKKEMTS